MAYDFVMRALPADPGTPGRGCKIPYGHGRRVYCDNGTGSSGCGHMYIELHGIGAGQDLACLFVKSGRPDAW